LVNRAVSGDENVLPELRRVLKAHPEMWHEYGDLAAQPQESWMHLTAGNNLLLHESLRLKSQELRADILGEKPSPLERLLVERVVATWLQVNYADVAFAQSNKPGVALSMLKQLQQRQESAQRSHLAAIKQLALVRKLLKPALSPLDLLSRPIEETVVRRAGYKVRRAESVAAGVPVEN